MKDVKDYIASGPKQIDWQQINISDIGAAIWSRGTSDSTWAARSPGGTSTSSRFRAISTSESRVTTPLQKAGAYLLVARMEGGNTSRIVVWLDDTVIVKKPLAGETLLLRRRCADRPACSAGRRRAVRLADGSGRGQERVPRRDQDGIALKTDVQRHCSGRDGSSKRHATAIISGSPPPERPRAGSLILGSRTCGHFPNKCSPHDQIKVYTITDRPVYRPGSPVRFKFWVARARYDQNETSEFAGKTFPVEIRNPKRGQVFTKEMTADAFGGFDGSFELPSDAIAGHVSKSSCPIRAAARSGSRSTRSPSSRCRFERRCAGDAR